MQSMPVPSKIIKRDQGLAHEVCPNTPDHLEVTYHKDQRIESICPKLHAPRHPLGYTPRLTKNCHNQSVTVKKERSYDPFRYQKMEGIDSRFWNEFHMDFYSSVILHKPNKPPIVPMKYVDWEFYENENNATFRKIIKKCKEFGLYELMGFQYHWNAKILRQFHSSYYFEASSNSIHWTTEGEHFCVGYMTFSRILGLGSKDEERDLTHVENQVKSNDVAFMFYNPILAVGGKANNLIPYYYVLNSFFQHTIDPKGGHATALNYYARNILLWMAPRGHPLAIFDFIWKELRRAMTDARKHLPYAPYIMYMIDRVTKVTYPKDCAHKPLHVRLRDDNKPIPSITSRRMVGSSSRAPRDDHDDEPRTHARSHLPPRGSRTSLIKRVLKSLFSMCKTMTHEVNANRWDILDLKEATGLPIAEPYHELLKVDDPFAEWDALDEADLAAIVPSRPPRARGATRPRRTARSPSPDEEEEEDDEEEDDEDYDDEE